MSLMGHAKSNYSVGGTKTRSALRSLFWPCELQLYDALYDYGFFPL